MSFSEKIFLLRSDCKLSQEDMAGRFDVSRQTISKWESGLSYPEIDKLIAISEMFNVSIDYLLKDNCKEKIQNDELEKIVLKFLGSSQDMGKISEQLIDIMKDGIIDDNEKLQLEKIVCILDEVEENIEHIKDLIKNKKGDGN
ncbi:MAG: helix-turn-helix domain-containing protein [Lachnospiraceae bacterium]|nr:helix-turn-helix domain-containing protein [Lachnospiraceae bacterium]